MQCKHLGQAEIRPTRMVDDGLNELSVGIRLRLVAEDLGVFSNLPGVHLFSAPLAAEHVNSCDCQSTATAENG